MTRSRLLPSILGVALAATCLSSALAAGWEREAKARLGADDEAEVERGAAICVENDSADAAKLLCAVIAKPPRDLAKLRAEYAKSVAAGDAPVRLGKAPRPAGAPGAGVPEPDDGGRSKELALAINARMAIERHVVAALAKLRSDDAVAWMLDKGLRHKAWKVRAEVAYALGVAKQNDASAKLQELIGDKHPLVRSLSIDGLAALGDRSAVARIVAALEDERWQVRVSAVQALVALRAIEATGPLIDRLEKEEGRLVTDVDAALTALTGERFAADPSRWRDWYLAHKAEIDAGTMKKAKAGDGATVERPLHSEFFGIPVDSKAVVFVIDYSKSMNRAFDRGGAGEGEGEGGGERRPETGGAPGSERPKTPPIEIDGDTRLAEAQEQSLRVLHAFPDRTRFNVIVYHWGVVRLADTMLEASPASKKQMHDRLLEEELGLGTNIFDALDRAFDISETGHFETNYQWPVDTIYLLTDGAPTSGRTADLDQMLERVLFWNRTRKIRIHTVLIRSVAQPDPDPSGKPRRNRGMRGAIRFMRGLAEKTGGRFVDARTDEAE